MELGNITILFKINESSDHSNLSVAMFIQSSNQVTENMFFIHSTQFFQS